ncbi:MAG TPA: hypothetical protein VGG85_10975 [Terracidiphilus sp.]|jgi:hypothetical protein
MIEDPVRYWQGITENYRQMGDAELRELAAGFGDLTDVAQQALRDEMRKRGLDVPQVPKGSSGALRWEPLSYRYHSAETPQETDRPVEFTWKTLLCECDTEEAALQIAMALEQAGIESWISRPSLKWGLDGPRVQVAADQLELAQAVLARPIPGQIIEESRQELPAFEAPHCPTCGGSDPVLVSVDPVNAWSCEACGAEWSDPYETSSDAGIEERK